MFHLFDFSFIHNSWFLFFFNGLLRLSRDLIVHPIASSVHHAHIAAHIHHGAIEHAFKELFHNIFFEIVFEHLLKS